MEADVGTMEALEKRKILQRLRGYRHENGLGCLDEVARKARSKGTITAMVLRDALIGSTSLSIEVWRKIDRALDKLEAERGG